MNHDDIQRQISKLAGNAKMDQAAAGIQQMVQLMRVYYDSAIANGFTEDQALQMTINYQNETWARTWPKPAPPKGR